MDPANGVDILEGFGAVLTMMAGGFAVFYELDLFYTVYYFLIKPKTPIKSITVILANVTLLLLFFSEQLIDFGRRYLPAIFERTSLEEGIVPIGLLLIYAILKVACLITQRRHSNESFGKDQ